MTIIDERPVDYARLTWYSQRHHLRYATYVERAGLPCQACHAMGGAIEPILDYGQGPWEECGWCEGTGKVTRWIRGAWLRWKRMGRP